MKNEFDRIMSEEEILPSSGFAASVMDAVRREAAAPPPIPFPWKRALPGAVFAAATLIVVLVICTMNLFDSSSMAQGQSASVSTWRLLLQVHTQWVILGLAAALSLWKIPSLLGLRS
ncbi:MAG: hypothetical protein WCG81_03255 [Candidatus Angelobacter sp.]